MLRYALTKKEGRKIIGKVIAIVGPYVVRLVIVRNRKRLVLWLIRTYLSRVDCSQGLQILHNDVHGKACSSQSYYLHGLAQVRFPRFDSFNARIVDVLDPFHDDGGMVYRIDLDAEEGD